ncbi:magnesium and cobalt transport protein CorA [Flindersiella endophytica]
MTVIDNAVYVDGQRIEPESLEQTYELLREQRGIGWIGLVRPDEAELASVAQEFGLHELAVEDALHAHQRPKLERYGDTLFVVLRPARYVDSNEVVEIGELHVFLGADFVVTIRHSDYPNLAPVRRKFETNPELLLLGPEGVLYEILDEVVDGYLPVLAGVHNDIDEIETVTFADETDVSRRVYELTREVIEFQRACAPLLDVLHSLAAGFTKYGVDVELQRLLRDIEDHTVRVVERVQSQRDLLQNLLNLNATLIAQRQNEEMKRLSEISIAQGEEVKRLSSWAAILFTPTVIGGVYGMNFDRIPELHWAFGYPFALGLMLLSGVVLWVFFKLRGWL